MLWIAVRQQNLAGSENNQLARDQGHLCSSVPCPDSPNETFSANRSGHGRPAPGSIAGGQQVSRYPTDFGCSACLRHEAPRSADTRFQLHLQAHTPCPEARRCARCVCVLPAVDLVAQQTADHPIETPSAAHWCCAATLKLGSKASGDAAGKEAGTGFGGLLGTITRSLSRQGSRPGPKDDKTVSERASSC